MVNEVLNMIEYELIDINFGYETPEEECVFVCEEEPSADDGVPQIEYDADGVPMGASMAEIRMREAMISDFLRNWSSSNTDRKVFNIVMHEYIYVRAISIIEAKEHSAKSYRSTRAVMLLDEILKNASPIKRVPKKSYDTNQKEFAYFLVMIYKHESVGSVKLTVGVKKNEKKVQYGISALKPGEPLVNYSGFKASKKRSPHR